MSVGAVEVNNMGARKHYLVLVVWSTIDRKHAGAAPPPLPERIEIALGGKTRVLALQTHEGRSLGIGDPVFRPDKGYLGESWYSVTPADLRAFADAAPESIDLVDDEGGRVAYGAWRRADAALAEFVRDIPDSVPSESRRPLTVASSAARRPQA